jgi:hypothetical protein
MRRRATPQESANNMSEPDYTSVDAEDPEDGIPSSFHSNSSITDKKQFQIFNPRSYNFRRRLSVAGVCGLFITAGLLASIELGRRRGHLSGERW